jgi:hypothetical protein
VNPFLIKALESLKEVKLIGILLFEPLYELFVWDWFEVQTEVSVFMDALYQELL